jgi:hypothetical protein
LAGTAAGGQQQLAVAGRDIIGQAKGILMHHGNLTGIQAFNVLIQASQQTNRKLVDVARWLVNETNLNFKTNSVSQQHITTFEQPFRLHSWAAGYGGDLAAQGYCAIPSKVAVGVCNSRTAGDVLRT